MATQIQFKRGTATSLQIVNPVLAAGEPCYETDTGKFKIGDGVTAWNDLAYRSVSSNATGVVGAIPVSNIVIISQADYDNIAVKDPNTIYFVPPATT
jgi:hypothetical protein